MRSALLRPAFRPGIRECSVQYKKKEPKKMKKVFAVTLLALFAFIAQASAAELRIAYANLQRALNECEAGIRAKEELKKEAQKLEAELTAKQEELKKLKEEIDKKGSVWNKETREAKQREFQAKSQELQKEFMRYSDELNKKRSRREGEIIRELKKVIKEIAEKEGYSYVFEYSLGGLLYAPDEADITDEVIKAYNARVKR